MRERERRKHRKRSGWRRDLKHSCSKMTGDIQEKIWTGKSAPVCEVGELRREYQKNRMFIYRKVQLRVLGSSKSGMRKQDRSRTCESA